MGRNPFKGVLAVAIAGSLGLLAIALLVVLVSGGSSGGAGPAQTSISNQGFKGAALPTPQLAPTFTLSDQHGRPVSLRALRGRPVVVAFLYTGCPRACALIAQQIRGALDELHEPVPVLLVSVDPAADTPARVRAFLAQVGLSARASYLRGPPGELRRVWAAYGVRTPAAAGVAAFEEAATVLLIDGTGRERVIYQQEQLTPEALAQDIGRLEAG